MQHLIHRNVAALNFVCFSARNGKITSCFVKKTSIFTNVYKFWGTGLLWLQRCFCRTEAEPQWAASFASVPVWDAPQAPIHPSRFLGRLGGGGGCNDWRQGEVVLGRGPGWTDEIANLLPPSVSFHRLAVSLWWQRTSKHRCSTHTHTHSSKD